MQVILFSGRKNKKVPTCSTSPFFSSNFNTWLTHFSRFRGILRAEAAGFRRQPRIIYWSLKALSSIVSLCTCCLVYQKIHSKLCSKATSGCSVTVLHRLLFFNLKKKSACVKKTGIFSIKGINFPTGKEARVGIFSEQLFRREKSWRTEQLK